MPMQCDIITQEKTVYSGQVDSVSLPGGEGRMGVLPHHTSVLTTLGFGEVIVRSGGEEEYFAIGGGFAEIQPDHVTILADSAESAEEIDLQLAEEARRQAEQFMAEGIPEDADTYQQIRASLMKAQVRLDVARRRGRRRSGITALGGRQEEEEG